jgi:hypothetical protein
MELYTPIWTRRGSSRWHLVALDAHRDEVVVLAVAADTHWDIPGTILDGPATDVADARRRAVRALMRAGLLPELPADPLSIDPTADGGTAWAVGT